MFSLAEGAVLLTHPLGIGAVICAGAMPRGPD